MKAPKGESNGKNHSFGGYAQYATLATVVPVAATKGLMSLVPAERRIGYQDQKHNAHTDDNELGS